MDREMDKLETGAAGRMTKENKEIFNGTTTDLLREPTVDSGI